MARRPDLEAFANRHGLKIGTIADLIRYRLEKEVSVERISEHAVQTGEGEFRLFCFEDHVNRTVHVALVHGTIRPDSTPLVRVHIQDTLGDVVGVRDPAFGWPLRDAMRRVAAEESGVIVILRDQEGPRELMEAVAAMERPVEELERRRDGAAVLRTYGVGAQILRDLGVHRMRVLSAPKQMHAISGFGLEVVDYVQGR